MTSKGNELLQGLYFRLKALWEKGKPFSQQEVKTLLKAILREYEDDTDIKEPTSTDNNK